MTRTIARLAVVCLSVCAACERGGAPAPAVPAESATSTPTAAPTATISPTVSAQPERSEAESKATANPTLSAQPEQSEAESKATPTANPTGSAQPERSEAESKATPVPAPTPVPVTLSVAVVAGQDLRLSSDDVTLVDPGATFRVEVAAHLADGRLALHDEQDAMVASTGTTEVGATSTKYQLAPDEPLRPGSKYALHLDGAQTREPHDHAGRAYAPYSAKLKTTGDRPAPAKKAAKGTGKRRRR